MLLSIVRRRLFLPLFGLLLALVAATPFVGVHVAWRLRPDRPLDVVAIDKTVPLPDYREHLGLYWLLAHRHIVRPEGGLYRKEWDYYGYRPVPPDEYQLRALPDDLGAPDLIWVVDTYGVYAEDIDPRYAYLGRHSRKVHGGATAREAAAIARAWRPGGTLVMEFNAFATPTEDAPRRALEKLAGVRWTGWTGRYFPDLADEGEVPVWLRATFEKRDEKPWSYAGPGYAFVHVDGRLLVLREPDDVTPELPRVRFTPAALKEYGPDDDVPYAYWFDVVEPAKGTEVLARHRLVPTARGRRYFEAAGLPAEFPAVVRRRAGGKTSWYFAGDFSDVGRAPETFRLAGTEGFFRTFAWWPAFDPQTFYWKVYVPLVGRILEDAVAARAARVGVPRTRVRGANDHEEQP